MTTTPQGVNYKINCADDELVFISSFHVQPDRLDNSWQPQGSRAALCDGLSSVQMEPIKISTVTKRKPFTREHRAAAVHQPRITLITPSCNSALPYLCLPAWEWLWGRFSHPPRAMGKRVRRGDQLQTELTLQNFKNPSRNWCLTSLKLSNIITNFEAQGV